MLRFTNLPRIYFLDTIIVIIIITIYKIKILIIIKRT